MRLYKTNQVTLVFTQNPVGFLNGLTSNAMSAPRNAFLNLHGRIIATFNQIIINEEEIWIVVGKQFVPAVKEHLDKYLKLAGVKLKETDKNIYFDLDGSYKPQDDERVIKQKAGQILITDRLLEANVTDEQFTLFRLQNDISMHGVDYQDEMLLNVSESEFVSYTKGCFLGQEFVSKVHNRSKPTWKLVVRYEDELGAEDKVKMTSRVASPESNRIFGFIFVKNE